MNAPKGYVFKVSAGVYGIIRYRPETTVELYQTETVGLYAVAAEIQQVFHGICDVADRDQASWGRVILMSTAKVTTN
jgi:hypothetical protein